MAFNPKEHMSRVQGGREYLEVKWRMVWFREQHPDWAIMTEIHLLDTDKQFVVFRATILDESGKVKAQATKAESAKGFPDYIEKAETGAVGRALAYCGFGTQYSGSELDEADRLADAPVERQAPPPPAQRRAEVAQRQTEEYEKHRGRGRRLESPPPPSDDEAPMPDDPFEEPQPPTEEQEKRDASNRFVAALQKAGLPIAQASGRPGPERKAIIQWALRSVTGAALDYDLSLMPATKILFAAEEIEKGKRPGLLNDFEYADRVGSFREGGQKDGG